MLFACFGEDYKAAADWFGVDTRTIYRWINGDTPPPLMAKKLLTIRHNNYLPDYYPFNEWKIKGTNVITPFGVADAFELEQFPVYRARYLAAENRVAELQARYERLLVEVDQLLAKIEAIRRLRSEIP